MLNSETWLTLSDAYAFLGNSLLAPMSQTPSVGLDPAFWEAFPTFGGEGVAEAVELCATYARREGLGSDADDHAVSAVERASVEYTRLFVGPPRPAAAPWETFYRGEGVSVGFGQATFEMRELLRVNGLELSVPNRQYEDHLGIELLLLSDMCRRVGEANEGTCTSSAGTDESLEDGSGGRVPDELPAVATFLDEHPLAWVHKLRTAVAEAAPGGYFDNLLGVVVALMAWHRAQLA